MDLIPLKLCFMSCLQKILKNKWIFALWNIVLQRKIASKRKEMFVSNYLIAKLSPKPLWTYIKFWEWSKLAWKENFLWKLLVKFWFQIMCCKIFQNRTSFKTNFSVHVFESLLSRGFPCWISIIICLKLCLKKNNNNNKWLRNLSRTFVKTRFQVINSI